MCLFYLSTLIKLKNRLLLQKSNLILDKNKYEFNSFKHHKVKFTLPEKFRRQFPNTNSHLSAMDVDAALSQLAKTELLQIFDTALAAVLPSTLINEQVQVIDGDKLVVNGKSYDITENVYLVGFGKAVAGMAYALQKILGPRLVRGIVSVPKSSLCHKINKKFINLHKQTLLELQNLQMLMRSNVIEYREGAANNQPDDASLATTEEIVNLVKSLTSSDTLIVLVSGGGSALLFQPKLPLLSSAKIELCRDLQNAGASITELNTVRKQLSSVKGGELAKIAYPANVLTFILSDIVRDPLEFIASGPTCPILEENSKDIAVDILKKYGLYNQLGEEVQTILSSNKAEAALDKGMIANGKFKHVENIIIGNNENALFAAKNFTKNFEMESLILTHTVEGNVNDISFAYAKLAKIACLVLKMKLLSQDDFMDEVLKQNIHILNITKEKLEEMYETLVRVTKNKSLLLLCGGEPTVVVEGDGKGGRNQELALQFSMDWLGQIAKDPQLARFFVIFLSAGTDGQDGPTDAAGAFGLPGFRPKLIKLRQKFLEQKKITPTREIRHLDYKIAQIEEMLPENVLKRNDTYNFFSRISKGENLVKTGLTGTNVMDLHFIYIKRRNCNCVINDVLQYDDSEHDESIEYLDFSFAE